MTPLAAALLDRASAEEYADTRAFLTQHPRALSPRRICGYCTDHVTDWEGIRTHGGVFCSQDCVTYWLARAGCCGPAS